MSRHLFLVCYDISDDRRQRQVREFLSAWRVSGQQSAAECWFSASELTLVKQQLHSLIDPSTDRLHIVRLDPRQPVLHVGKLNDFNQKIGSFFIH